MTILHQDVVASESATLLRELAEVRAENERLKARAMVRGLARLSCKVSAKGGVSVYGMGRWPVTLYAEQWGKLALFMPEVLAFIQDNAHLMSSKDDGKPE